MVETAPLKDSGPWTSNTFVNMPVVPSEMAVPQRQAALPLEAPESKRATSCRLPPTWARAWRPVQLGQRRRLDE